MLRTNGYPLLVVSAYLVFAAPVFCFAKDPSQLSRDAIIQMQMDCVGHNLKGAVDWQDVCYAPQTPAQDQAGKTQAVNQQLDTFENSQVVDTGAVFSNPQTPDAQKEFSNVQIDAQKGSSDVQAGKTGPVGMAKEIIGADLFPTAKPKFPSDVKTRTHTLDVGTEFFYYRFVKPNIPFFSNNSVLNNTTVNFKNTGPMEGFYANYAYRPSAPNPLNNSLTNVYFLQGRYAMSDDISFTGIGEAKKQKYSVTELRGMVGKDYYVGTDAIVTPYFGFGYRYLYEHAKGRVTSDNIVINDEKSQYYYLPVGFDTRLNLSKDWEIDPNIEYDSFLGGFQKSYSSQQNALARSDFTNMVFPQHHGYGMRTSVKFLKKGPIFDYYVEPFFRYWSIDNSKTETTTAANGQPEALGEGSNTTIEIGSKFGVQF